MGFGAGVGDGRWRGKVYYRTRWRYQVQVERAKVQYNVLSHARIPMRWAILNGWYSRFD